MTVIAGQITINTITNRQAPTPDFAITCSWRHRGTDSVLTRPTSWLMAAPPPQPPLPTHHSLRTDTLKLCIEITRLKTQLEYKYQDLARNLVILGYGEHLSSRLIASFDWFYYLLKIIVSELIWLQIYLIVQQKTKQKNQQIIKLDMYTLFIKQMIVYHVHHSSIFSNQSHLIICCLFNQMNCLIYFPSME